MLIMHESQYLHTDFAYIRLDYTSFYTQADPPRARFPLRSRLHTKQFCPAVQTVGQIQNQSFTDALRFGYLLIAFALFCRQRYTAQATSPITTIPKAKMPN